MPGHRPAGFCHAGDRLRAARLGCGIKVAQTLPNSFRNHGAFHEECTVSYRQKAGCADEPPSPYFLRLARLPEGARRLRRAHPHAAARRRLRHRATTQAPISWSSTPVASSTTRRKSRSTRSARRCAENGKVIVTGCLGARAGADPRRHPRRARRSPGRSLRERGRSGPRAPAAAARPVRRPRAAAGHQADAAPLRVSEDLRGLQPPLQLLHHPVDARRSRQPADRRC